MPSPLKTESPEAWGGVTFIGDSFSLTPGSCREPSNFHGIHWIPSPDLPQGSGRAAPPHVSAGGSGCSGMCRRHPGRLVACPRDARAVCTLLTFTASHDSPPQCHGGRMGSATSVWTCRTSSRIRRRQRMLRDVSQAPGTACRMPQRCQSCLHPPDLHGIARLPSPMPWGAHGHAVPSPMPGRGSGDFGMCRGAKGRLFATSRRNGWCPHPPNFHSIPPPSPKPWGAHGLVLPSPTPGRGSGGFGVHHGVGGRLLAVPGRQNNSRHELLNPPFAANFFRYMGVYVELTRRLDITDFDLIRRYHFHSGDIPPHPLMKRWDGWENSFMCRVHFRYHMQWRSFFQSSRSGSLMYPCRKK